MKKIHTVMAGLIAGVSLAVATASFAQPFGGGMGHGGPGMGMGPGHGPMAAGDPAAMVDARLAAMKTQLQITAAQEAAWAAFAAAARQQATAMQALHTQMQQGTGTAPERMAQRAAAMQQRSAGMAAMSTVFASLYAVLTPEQKAFVDQHAGRFAGERGMGMGRHAG